MMASFAQGPGGDCSVKSYCWRLPFVSDVLPLVVITFDMSSSLGLQEKGQMS